jgi:hypothetical protein
VKPKVTIIDSCGCVFCDLGIKPVFEDRDRRRLVHLVRIGTKTAVVDCTKDPNKEAPG